MQNLNPPTAKGLKRLTRFGIFRDQFQSSLWARSVALLRGFYRQEEITA
jgi:hypothetical protein